MTDVVSIGSGDEPAGRELVPDPGAVPVMGDPETVGRPHKRPLYPRLLHLQHIHPNAWQRAVLGEGMALVGLLLALADLASAWAVVVLPLAVALVVKAHDVLAGQLAHRG
ncbi:MAG: hypothetical protein WCD35_13590 [Mycobacteriales bacterium]